MRGILTQPAAMLRATTLLCFGLLAATAQAQAQTTPGLGRLHGFKDWVLGCDNTRRCEAQGYGAETEGAPPGGIAALIVRREAGPGKVPVLRFAYSSADSASLQPAAGQAVTVQAGALRFRMPAATQVNAEPEVPPAQVAALLAAALKSDHIRLSAGTAQWSVSMAGATAALLKMDELQGRVGTPGALVRKGSRPETAVPEPAAPMVLAAQLPPTTPQDLALEPRLRAALPRSERDCPDFDPAQPLGAPLRLTATTLLMLQPCWRGAYQTGSRLWQVDDKPPHRARALRLPAPGGGSDDTLVAEMVQASGGTLDLHEAAKGRGIGDCWVSRNWTWTGDRLALVDAQESACKAFEAGGLMIPLWRTQGR